MGAAGRPDCLHGLDGIRLIAPTGGPSRLLVPSRADSEPFYVAWSQDGRTLYYLEQSPSGWVIKAISPDGGPSRLLVRFDDPSRQHSRYGFATDDHHFWFTLGTQESDVWVLELNER